MEENEQLDEASKRKIDFINVLSDTVTHLEQQIRSSDFLTKIIISIFDKDFLKDITNIQEFLQEIKTEINELRKEIENESNSG